MGRSLVKRYSDHEILSDIGSLDGIEVRGLIKGRAKLAINSVDYPVDYSTLVEAATGAAAMTYLEKGERIELIKPSGKSKESNMPLLSAEASVSRRIGDEISVNVSVLGTGGKTVDFKTLTYKVTKR